VSAGPRVSSGSEIHVSLAPARDPFLPLEPEKGGPDQPAPRGSATGVGAPQA
jgi:hypothetical protein